MYRAIIAITGMMVLTGCSELQVIGKATLRELTADSISVDSERYKSRSARTRLVETQAVIVKASLPDGKTFQSGKKELWRHN